MSNRPQVSWSLIGFLVQTIGLSALSAEINTRDLTRGINTIGYVIRALPSEWWVSGVC